MKRINLQDTTVEQLVKRFISIAEEQDRALTWDETAEYNQLYDLIDDVIVELAARPGDQRRKRWLRKS